MDEYSLDSAEFNGSYRSVPNRVYYASEVSKIEHSTHSKLMKFTLSGTSFAVNIEYRNVQFHTTLSVINRFGEYDDEIEYEGDVLCWDALCGWSQDFVQLHVCKTVLHD